MIIARIDNQISARTPHRRGRSFIGALKYLLTGSKAAPKPDRVLHAETVNICADLEDAAHEMASTWEARFALMRAADLVPKNGADNTSPVYHLVISWSADEDPPPPAEMADLAKQLLNLLGLGEHEAVLVVHGDTENPHIHIIANTVHPVTGRTAPLQFDKRTMQGFALRYEELRGKIVCEGRFTPRAKNAFNAAARDTASGKRASRPRWARDNGPAMDAKRAALPSVVLDALTRHHATFSAPQLAQAVTASTRSAAEFCGLMAAIMNGPDLVTLDDGRGGKKYTTRTQQNAEKRLAESAGILAGSTTHSVSTAARADALSRFAGSDQSETRAALAHLLDERGLSVVVGYAGAGKSTLLRTAAQVWTASGYRLRGLALAGRAAEGLEADADIPSGTIAAFLMGLDSGTVSLSSRDVLVIDEAGMVASRQLDLLLMAARNARAKVVLVGDPEQLQAIEAGGPFRYIVDHYDHARLTTVWRQKEFWMREATRQLAEGGTQLALTAYENAGMLHAHDAKGDAIASILDMWLANRERGISQLILTATNADAALVNAAARARLKELGALGHETILAVDDGPTAFAVGDRIVFRRNDRKLGVKNGTVATVTAITGSRMSVNIEGHAPRVLVVDLANYPHLSHGYGLTIHKSQGATVDRAYVLAAPNMDRHSAYVALSRHRERVSLHWSKDVFPNAAALARRLARKRLKDLSLDYREIITAGVRSVLTVARKRTTCVPDVDQWAQLYAAQRTEADRVAHMSLVRRAFWFAANADRFLTACTLTIAKLHERERSKFSMALRSARTPPPEVVPSQSRRSRARPTAEIALGLATSTPAIRSTLPRLTP